MLAVIGILFTSTNTTNSQLSTIARIPDPVGPSLARPITTSDVLVISPGEQIGFRVFILNTAAVGQRLTPHLECSILGLTMEPIREPSGLAKNVLSWLFSKLQGDKAKVEKFTLMVKFPNSTAPGNYLCEITATDEVGTAVTDKPVDVVFLVQK